MGSELAQLDEYGEHLVEHGQGSGGVYLLKVLQCESRLLQQFEIAPCPRFP